MFDEIAALSDDAEQMFAQAAQQLVQAGQFHGLFDLRLLEHRHQLGLALDREPSLDTLQEPLRRQLEEGYLSACREVGQLLLDAGQPRAAWTYLRPAGEKAALRRWLEQAVPDDECIEELLQIALYEGVDPERGFAWLLAHRGTCNAVTDMESLAGSLPIAEQAACARVLVRHMHQELLENLRGHLSRLEQSVPQTDSVTALLTECPGLVDDGAYHVDTSHLATTVRYARTLTDPATLRLAVELTGYGGRLDPSLQYPDQSPFEDLYATHQLFFGAILGDEVERAVDYFRQRARDSKIDQDGTGPVETYLILLDRVQRSDTALAEYNEIVPQECVLSPYAPSLLQLAQRSGNWDRYFEICQHRSDVVGFAAGQLARRQES